MGFPPIILVWSSLLASNKQFWWCLYMGVFSCKSYGANMPNWCSFKSTENTLKSSLPIWKFECSFIISIIIFCEQGTTSTRCRATKAPLMQDIHSSRAAGSAHDIWLLQSHCTLYNFATFWFLQVPRYWKKSSKQKNTADRNPRKHT